MWHCQAMRLYLVWDSEGVSEKEDTVVESLFKAIDAEGDSEDGNGKKRKKRKAKKNKKSSGSSSSEDSDDSNSSDSSQSADDNKTTKHSHYYQRRHHTSQDKKKKKKAKKGSKAEKGKKPKKETEEQKNKRMEKEAKKKAKEDKAKLEKAEKEHFAKGRKVLNSINQKIAGASRKTQVINAMCPALKSAISDDFQKLWQNMVECRDLLQNDVDTRDASTLDGHMKECEEAEKDYADFLTRANLK
eukprot:s1245_g9.t1